MADSALADLPPAAPEPDDLVGPLVRAGASYAAEVDALVALLGTVRLARQAGAGPAAAVAFQLPAGFPAFRLLGWLATAVDGHLALRLSADAGATWRTSHYQYAAQILNTANGAHNSHRTGFNVTDGTAGWFYVGQRAGHPSCLDLTLQAARDAGRRTAWRYAWLQHHTSGSGRGGFGGGHHLVAEAHDAVQLRAVGTAADIVDFDLPLYGIQ